MNRKAHIQTGNTLGFSDASRVIVSHENLRNVPDDLSDPGDILLIFDDF